MDMVQGLCEEAFQKVKRDITPEQVLTHYDGGKAEQRLRLTLAWPWRSVISQDG